MKKSVIPIPSTIMIITLLCVLQGIIFFEMNSAFGEGENFVIDDNVKTMIFTQQEVETECKSPCPSSAEMCIEMCE